MDNNSKKELDSIRLELSSVIRELQDISNGIRKDFDGIDSCLCSNCINTVIAKCKKAQEQLKKLDLVTLSNNFQGEK